jgi:glycosyltransferase involved in cell wall biosynthesis
MKIGVDLRRIVFGETGGLTQWLHGVLSAVFARADPHTYVLFNTVYNYHLFPDAPARVERRTLSTQCYYEELQDQVAFDGDFDLLLRYYPLGVLDRFPLDRQIVCIPDCQHEVFPEFFIPPVLRERRQAFDTYQSCGGAIATLTEFSRRELLASPWTTIEDVFLLPPGVPRELSAGQTGELTDRERAQIPARPFFLYSANLWEHKNHRRIVQAFELFRRTHPDYELVFTGHPQGWEALAPVCRGLPVHHLGYVRPRLLAELQRRAVALAHLSLYEGFGIPILEAFAAGTPVVCGDRTAMPEVAGKAALICDPTSVDAIAAALARVADDEVLRSRLRAEGHKRLADFSWERSAAILLAAFERVASRAAPLTRARLGEPSVRVTTPPVVSIVTPSFNQGAFIRQTIDSVLGQDYPHIDYRVVDGGSTDDSVAVLKSYGDRVPWVSEKDRGQTHAINKGMAQARGSIRAYLNSDDLLRPGAVSRVVEHFRTSPACDLVYGRDALIDAEGRYLRMYPTRPYDFDDLVEQCCISQPAAFWRSRLADRIGPFDESLTFVMDYEYWLRAGRTGARMEHIPDVLAHTRYHRQAKTSGGGDKLKQYRKRVFREIFEVSVRHAGYVSPRYIDAWIHAEWFSAHPWMRRYEQFISRAVKTWYDSRYKGKNRPWRAFVSVLFHERRFMMRSVRRTLSGLAPWKWFRAAPPSAPRVRLEADLWLGPALELAHAGGPVRLTGVPARDSVLRLYRGEQELAAVELHENEPADVCVDVPEPGPLRLAFSDADELMDGRDAAFRLHGTTLFTERDAA